MINTSLQHILSSVVLNNQDLKNLFQRKTYPEFELTELKAHGALSSRDTFLFFIKILQKWNKDVGKGSDKVNDCEYVKNDFIYSWLKSIVVQNQKHMDTSLNQLYSWYSSNKFTQPVSLFKKQSKNTFKIQQWEIRNSYKSNLPLEIDSYKRRYIFQQKNENDFKIPDGQASTTANSPNLSLQKENYKSINFIRKENNFVKNAREDNQMKNFLQNYKKKKVQFYKNMTKNYEKNEFQNDKIIIKPKNVQTQQKFYQTDHIKNNRIKTANQSRPFRQANLYKTENQFYNRKTSKQFLAQGENIGLKEDNERFALVNCDSIGLLVNPFDIKLKKKKK